MLGYKGLRGHLSKAFVSILYWVPVLNGHLMQNHSNKTKKSFQVHLIHVYLPQSIANIVFLSMILYILSSIMA